jgi:hypothetical protein
MQVATKPKQKQELQNSMQNAPGRQKLKQQQLMQQSKQSQRN